MIWRWPVPESYLNYADGVGHILDPRTRGPIKHDLLAVTVMADTCFEADTIATGAFVMGKVMRRRHGSINTQNILPC